MWFSSGRSPSGGRRRPRAHAARRPRPQARPSALEAELAERLARSRRGRRRAARRGRCRSRDRSRASTRPRPRPSGASKARRRRRGRRLEPAGQLGERARPGRRRAARRATSAPGSRGPSAANSVSLPRRASAPTSVKSSVRSITCMPRCSQSEVGERRRGRRPRARRGRARWRREGRTFPARYSSPHATMSGHELLVGPRTAAHQARARVHGRDGRAAGGASVTLSLLSAATSTAPIDDGLEARAGDAAALVRPGARPGA